jgi:hypothetical protein
MKDTALALLGAPFAIVVLGACHRSEPTLNVHRPAATTLGSPRPGETETMTAGPSTLKLSYPYDGTVFPPALPPPEIMWEGVAKGEKVRISLRSPMGHVAETVTTGRPASYTFAPATWRTIADTSKGETEVEIEIASSADATRVVRSKVRVSDVPLTGVLYFWSSSITQMLRWTPKSATTEKVFPLPPAPGPGKAPCIKCHTVSRDGSLMALAGFDAPGAATLVDTRTREILTDIAEPPYTTMFQALHPQGLRLVSNRVEELELFDVSNRRAPRSLGSAGLPTHGAAQPTFAPSGDTLVFALHTNRASANDFTESDLAVAPFDARSDRFGEARIIALGGGKACAYPSVLPDERHVVFQRGDHARSSNSGGVVLHHGELALASLSGGPVRTLELGTSAGTSVRDARSAFQPAAPITANGRYDFVAFVSLRDYGTRLVHQFRRQIWITAVDRDLTAEDPSHPAFWLPGQDPVSTQMMPGWASAPPADDGEP